MYLTEFSSNVLAIFPVRGLVENVRPLQRDQRTNGGVWANTWAATENAGFCVPS